jgi:alpha-D-ribose 1-methylphosphonate 5-triphosphate synthase subunit PhnI
MALADTSRAQVRYIPEISIRRYPGSQATPPTFAYTGESLDFAIGGDSSKEIRADRQKSGFNQLSASASGG